MPKPQDDLMEEQVEDLRTRMTLLQSDRRANVALLQTQKAMNATEILALRDENKALRVRLGGIKMSMGSSGGGGGGVSGGGEMGDVRSISQKISNLKQTLLVKRKEYDDVKTLTTQSTSKLHNLNDEASTCKLEATRPDVEDTPLTRSIRVLENRLDKAMIKYNESQSIRRTYDQIVVRLRDERVGFDNQLGSLERTLVGKSKDYDELVLLSGDANHAREVSYGELERCRRGYEEERMRRERELRERQQVVILRSQAKDRQLKREVQRAKIYSDNSNETHTEHDKIRDAVITNDIEARRRAEAKSRIDIFENAFRKIKEATGVSSVHEVIAKIMSQEGTMENLLSLTKENQARMETLQEEHVTVKSSLDILKFSAPVGGHRRKIVDDTEDLIATSSARLNRSIKKFERLDSILTQTKAGVGHVLTKMLSVSSDYPVLLSHMTVNPEESSSSAFITGLKPNNNNNASKASELTDDTVVVVLKNICEVGESMVLRGRIKEIEDDVIGGTSASGDGDNGVNSKVLKFSADSTFNDDGNDEDDEEKMFAEERLLTKSRPYNQRVNLPNSDDWDSARGGGGANGDDGDNGGSGGGGNGGGNGGGEEEQEEELTRQKVKKASMEVVSDMEKKRIKLAKSGGRK